MYSQTQKKNSKTFLIKYKILLTYRRQLSVVRREGDNKRFGN